MFRARQQGATLGKVGGWESSETPECSELDNKGQHLEKLEVGSLPGLSNVQSSTARGKTPCIGMFLVSLKRS